MENNTYNIYYNEEGDFLELILSEPPSSEGTNEAESEVFVYEKFKYRRYL